MLSDDEIKALGRDAFGIDPILDGNLMRYARAVERAAYERAAQGCEKLIKRTPEDRWDHGYDLIGKALADAIRALGRQQ